MRTVRQLLEGKSTTLVTIAPDAPVLDAIRRMAEAQVGAVLVMEGAQLVGIVSERDYARKIVLAGRTSHDTPVRAIMTADVVTVAPTQNVQDCMALMTDRRFRHLPVVEADAVVGVVSIGDLVAAVISEQKHELDQLQRYIAS